MIGSNTLEGISFVTRENINKSKLKQKLIYEPGGLCYDLQKYSDRYNIVDKESFCEKIMDIYDLNTRGNKENLFLDYVEIITDECYKCPTYLFADIYSRFDQNAFVYLYDHKFYYSDRVPEEGADHGAEIAILFAYPLSSKEYPEDEKLFTEEFIHYWTNFIKYDDPNISNSGSVAWLPFNTDNTPEKNVILLKANHTRNTKYSLADPKYTFWNL